MRKTTLFAAAVAALVLIGIETWLACPLLVRARRLFELGVRDRQYGSDIPAGCIADERLADQKCVVLWRFARKASHENDGDKNLHYVA
jgi:hypothetical protein